MPLWMLNILKKNEFFEALEDDPLAELTQDLGLIKLSPESEFSNLGFYVDL